MPFTLAHPLLPLLVKKGIPRLSLSAAIAGSVMPDMANFFRMYEYTTDRHSLMEILLFDFLTGILLCFLYHHLIRNAFIEHLPRIYRQRYLRYKTFNWSEFARKNKIVVMLSLLTGIVTHFAWDAITHKDGLVVGLIPLLTIKIQFWGKAYPVFHLLQLLFSIAGMWLLHRYILQRPTGPETNQDTRNGSYYWLLYFLFFLFLLIIRLYGWPGLNSYLGVWRAVMGALIYAWILVSLIFYHSANRINSLKTSPYHS